MYQSLINKLKAIHLFPIFNLIFPRIFQSSQILILISTEIVTKRHGIICMCFSSRIYMSIFVQIYIAMRIQIHK